MFINWIKSIIHKAELKKIRKNKDLQGKQECMYLAELLEGYTFWINKNTAYAESYKILLHAYTNPEPENKD
jgi:hypothetical protein